MELKPKNLEFDHLCFRPKSARDAHSAIGSATFQVALAGILPALGRCATSVFRKPFRQDAETCEQDARAPLSLCNCTACMKFLYSITPTLRYSITP